MIDLATIDRIFDEMKAAYDMQAQPLFLMSPEMKHRLDVTISQRSHQRLLRKCQYRRIYRRRKRGR